MCVLMMLGYFWDKSALCSSKVVDNKYWTVSKREKTLPNKNSLKETYFKCSVKLLALYINQYINLFFYNDGCVL